MGRSKNIFFLEEDAVPCSASQSCPKPVAAYLLHAAEVFFSHRHSPAVLPCCPSGHPAEGVGPLLNPAGGKSVTIINQEPKLAKSTVFNTVESFQRLEAGVHTKLAECLSKLTKPCVFLPKSDV